MREIETVMRIGSKITVRIPSWRRFDLDNASTEVSQQGRSVRSSNKGRALKNGNVLQGLDRHETFLSKVARFGGDGAGSAILRRSIPLSKNHRGSVSRLVRLHVPSLDGNVNAVAFRIVKSHFSKRNAAGAGSAAASPGLFGAIADLLEVIYVETEMIKAILFLTHSLVQKREIKIAIRNEDRRAIAVSDFLHAKRLAVKIRQSFGIGGVKRDMPDGIAGFLRHQTEVFGRKIDQILIRVSHLSLALRRRLPALF